MADPRMVYLALPAYTGSVRVETMQALIHEMQCMMMNGIVPDLKVNAGDSILPRCRNMFLRDFYDRKEYTDFVFLDHDIVWPGHEAVLTNLIRAPYDFVAGVYPKRADPLEFPVRWGKTRDRDRNGMIEVDGVPAGFMRLTRACVDRLMAAYEPTHSYEENGLDGKKAVNLFSFELMGGRYHGEDYVFCDRWREIGGTIHVDPDIQFQHVGFKRFEGSLGAWMHTQTLGPDDVSQDASAA